MISLAYAQDATQAVANAGPFGAASQFVPIILIVAVFYFLLIRPQQKQQKMLRQMIADAKRGDEVIMTSGIIGKITDLQDDIVMLQVANNVIIKFQRSCIQSIKGYEIKK